MSCWTHGRAGTLSAPALILLGVPRSGIAGSHRIPFLVSEEPPYWFPFPIQQAEGFQLTIDFELVHLVIYFRRIAFICCKFWQTAREPIWKFWLKFWLRRSLLACSGPGDQASFPINLPLVSYQPTKLFRIRVF